MSCTLFFVDNTQQVISVRSPYSASFAAEARQRGGRWNAQARVWQFEVRQGWTVNVVRSICQRHYDSVSFVNGDAPVAPPQDAGFVGKINEKLTVMLTVVKTVDLTDGNYGPARLHIMRDAADHVFIWRASRERLDVKDVVTLQGTVKRHDTYRDVSQTVLTRCKVITRKQDGVLLPAQLSVPEHVVPEESGEIEEQTPSPAMSLAEEVGF